MKIKNQSVSHTPDGRSTNRRKLIMAAAVLVVAIGWYLFRPELIFVSRSVNEEFPVTAAQQMTASNASPTLLSQGRFHGVSHETKGVAALYQFPDGKRVLRFTEFECRWTSLDSLRKLAMLPSAPALETAAARWDEVAGAALAATRGGVQD